MALSIILSDGTTTVNLHTAPSVLMPGSRLGIPAYQRVFSETWGRGFFPLTGVNVGNRQAEFRLRIEGTSTDAWITNVQNLAKLLQNAELYHASGGVRGAAVTLSVQLDGATNATVFDVLGGEIDASAAVGAFSMKNTSRPLLAEIPLTLILKPYGRPASATTIASGSLSNGINAYTVSAPAGDREAPAKITFQSGAGAQFERVLLARRTRGNVANFLWAMECETGSYGSYTVTNVTSPLSGLSLSNVADANARGGSKLRISVSSSSERADADIIQFEILSYLADHYGRFRVFVHSLGGSTNLTGIRLAYGGKNGKDIMNARVNNPPTANRLIDLGIMEIPHRPGPPDVNLSSFKFRLLGSYPAGNYFLWDIDNVFLVPVDEQYADINLSPAAAAQDKLVNDNIAPLPTVYHTDSANNLKPSVITANADTRFSLVPGRNNLFICLFFNTSLGGFTLNQPFSLELSYYPLFELFR